VKTIDDLFKYGEDSAKLGLGAFFCRSNDVFAALLKLLTQESPKLHKKLVIVFNNSLIQTSISSMHGWSDCWETEGRNKSIHIRKALQAVPTLAKKKLEGRLSLHYAAASNTASFDAVMDILEANPEAASVSDTMTLVRLSVFSSRIQLWYLVEFKLILQQRKERRERGLSKVLS
jgi:hypothetical protein